MTPLQTLLADLLSVEDRAKIASYERHYLSSEKFLKANREVERERENAVYQINGSGYKIDGVLDYTTCREGAIENLRIKTDAFQISETTQIRMRSSYLIFIEGHLIPQMIVQQMIGATLDQYIEGFADLSPLTERLVITEVRQAEIERPGDKTLAHITFYCDHADHPFNNEMLNAA